MNTPYEAPHLWPETLEIMNQGLEIVRQRHGENGISPRVFHNDFHALEVVSAGLLICREVQASETTQNIVAIAGIFHDSFQDQGKQNETMSAIQADEVMRKTGDFKASLRETVCRTIMATVVRIEDDCFRQSAKTFEGKIIADADMSNIGRDTPYYRERGAKLFQEQQPGEPGNGQAMYEFLVKSDPVLRTHDYYLPQSKALFPYQRQNLLFAQAFRHKLGQKLALE